MVGPLVVGWSACLWVAAPGELVIDLPDEVDAAVREQLESDLRETADTKGLRAGAPVDEIRVVITDDGGTYHIAAAAVRADGTVSSSVAGDCEICGARELSETSVDLLSTLLGRVVATPDRGSLKVVGTPDGAEIRIDDVLVGTTPFVASAPEGAHVVEIRAPGHVAQRYEWNAIAGVSETFSHALAHEPATASAPDPSPTRSERTSRTWLVPVGWSALGVGVGAVGLGAALMAVDGREYDNTCSAQTRDVNGLCPESYRTRNGGIVSLSLGVAAVAASVPVLVLGYRQGRDTSVALGPGTLHVRGRF